MRLPTPAAKNSGAFLSAAALENYNVIRFIPRLEVRHAQFGKEEAMVSFTER